MNRRRSAVLLLLALLGFFAQAQDYQRPHEQPGPALDVIYVRSFPLDVAPLELKAGKMDVYLFGIRPAAAQTLRGIPELTLYEAAAGTNSIILNPAPAPEGEFNPFAIKAVRQALHYLINRDYVVNEIHKGAAVPMLAHISSFDYDYLTLFELLQAAELGYNPERARTMINEAMSKAGATQIEGVWHYQDKPVSVKFIIRTEDERREIGDVLAAELEKAGLKVERLYREFGPALKILYETDPKEFQWHLYTEGWGRAATVRYDTGTINQMYAPWWGNMPGWQEQGFWQYEHPQIDELGKRVYRMEVASKEERDAAYREAAQLGLEESVRIYVINELRTFATNKNVLGVTLDSTAGLRNPFFLRAAYIPGKNSLTIGHLWVWTERTTWNPVAGFGDVYSVDPWRNIYDPAVWNHPFTGVPMPFRAPYTVETAGPKDKLAVPADAVMWNAAGRAWTPVGEGVQAVSKVVFDFSKYYQSVFHHEQNITPADLFYELFQIYDIVFNTDKAQIESSYAASNRPVLEQFKGYRLRDDKRLEVYLDYWHFDENMIASRATPSSFAMPWEVLAAMDRVVFTKRQAAYSDTAAGKFKVPWLSLVLEQHAQMVRDALIELQDQPLPPALLLNGQALVTPEEVQARIKAALAWFDKYKHLVISSGSFYLARFDPEAQFAELRAFRHPTYPFKAGDLYLGLPEPIEFAQINAPELHIGEPLQITVELKGRGKLGLRYALIDTASAKIVASGEAQETNKNFTIALAADITKQLSPGLYRLALAAYSDMLSRVSEEQRMLTAQLPPAPPAPTTPQPPAPPAAQPAPTTPPTTPTPPTADNTWPMLGFALGALAVAALVIWFATRRRVT